MKKTYINPEMEVVKLQLMSMLAASLEKGVGGKNAEESDASYYYDFENEEYEDELDW